MSRTVLRIAPLLIALTLGALSVAPGADAQRADGAVPIRPVPTPSLADVAVGVRAKVEAARQDLDALQSQGQPAGESFGTLGSRYLHVGKLDAALVALENAVGLKSEQIQWRYYLAVTLERRGDLEGAAAALRRVLASREGNLPAVLRLADVLAELGVREEARELYQAALQSPLGVPAGRAGLAKLASDAGDYSAAILHLEAAIEAQPAATNLHRRLSHALAAAGRSDASARALRRAGEVRVRYPDPLMLQLALEMGDPNVELRPDAPAPAPAAAAPDLIESGSTAFLEGDREEGLALLEKAVAEAPESLEARQRLASALLVQSRLPDALPHLEKAAKLAPENRGARLQLAQAYFELKRLEDAAAEVDVLLAAPTAEADYEARLIAGQIAAARQDPQGAEGHFRRVAESTVAPKGLRSRAYFNLGLVRQASRRIEEAVGFYRQSLDFDPNQRQALFNLGLIMASNDRHSEALEFYRRLFELQPNNVDLRLRLGVSLMRIGEFWPALGHFEALLKAKPDDVEALVSSALLLDQVDQSAQARERLRDAAARLKDPADRARILAALGGLERRAGDKAAGLASLRRAVAGFGDASTSPEAAEAHRDLARALAQDGLYGDADRHFGAYLKARPNDTDIHFARSMALILADDDAGAAEVLREATSRLDDVALTHLYARLLAGSTEVSVRQGERAVEIAKAVFEKERNPFHGETLAMAYAAAGRFEEALVLQRRLLQEAKAADFNADFIGRVERNLTRYEVGQPGVFGW